MATSATTGEQPRQVNHAPPTVAQSAAATTANNTTNSTPSQLKTTAAPPNVPAVVNLPLSARRSERLDLSTVERKGKPLPGWREPGSRTHAGGIVEAPSYRPSEEEWKNPMEYMRKISVEGSKYGIVKVIPPDSWSPDFVIDSERFHFKTRKQELNSVEGGTRANLNYLEQLTKYHRYIGGNLVRFPSVDKRPLDLYELKKAVQARGGFERVCERKKWAEIGRALGYTGKIMSSLSTSLKHSYERWLLPYEQWLAAARPMINMQLEQERGGPFGTPSPGTSPFKKSNPHTPSNLAKETPAIEASQALQYSIDPRQSAPQMQQMPVSPPRSTGFTAVNSKGFTAVNGPGFTAANGSFRVAPQPMSNGVNGHHVPPERPPPHDKLFVTGPGPPPGYASFELKRSHSEMSEDTKDRHHASDAHLPKKPRQNPAPTVTGSHMFQHRFPNLNVASLKASNGLATEKCETCSRTDDKRTIVTCESCDNSYHLYCLEPALKEMPRNEWHCSRCLVGTGEFGFEEGGTYSLKQFQTKANDFKENYFKGKTPYDPISDKMKPVTEDEVEKEFWRLVLNPTETVEVEYGADIHSTTHGSGFPTIERNPRDPYSTDPWNLNILPLHQDSLFKHIKTDISGMTVPWLYVGMCFSTFCWHNEDHYAYSANYQHFGATKTWYGIPGADAEKFEAAMRKEVPELFESQPDLLFQLVTLLTPETLRKYDVNVYAVDQRAGQFVITFPQAYHAGFNHGFNFNEAVNFAPSDWEPFGRSCVDRYRDFRKASCFSHDELLLTAAAAKDVSIRTARWLAPALQAVVDRELYVRRQFYACVVDSSVFSFKPNDGENISLKFDERIDVDVASEDDYICSYCKTYTYLSRFICENTKNITCLDHVTLVDWGLQESDLRFVVHIKVPDQKLEQILGKIRENAHRPEAWVEKYYANTDGIAKPSLKSMKALVAEGERIPWPLKELPALKKSVDACNEWVEEAINFIARKQQNRRKNDKVWRKGSHVKAAEADEKEKEYRKISSIKRLLQRAEDISFDCPEITTLQDKLDQITEFQRDARAAIESIANKKAQDVQDLIEVGRGYSVDIPEISHLEKILEQMQWVEKAKNPVEAATLKGVDALLQEAADLNVPDHHISVRHLRAQKHDAEQLSAKIQNCLSEDASFSFARLEDFAKRAMNLPINEDILTEMNIVLKKHRDAQKRIGDLVQTASEPFLKDRPTYKDMQACCDSIKDLNSKPEGYLELERLQKRHEDWMRRGKKLFGKTNAPLPILLQHLLIVDERNRYCFDVNEQPKGPIEPSSRSNTPEPEGIKGQSPVFCLCRKPEEGTMIECKTCHEWYHSKCLKIARGKYKDEDDFDCPVCDHRVKIPRDADRPKLEELISWQSEMDALPFQPDEEEVLSSIIDTADNFRNYVRQFTDNSLMTTMEDVPTLRFYLRKIEGADILLAQETNFFRQELYKFHPIAPEAPPEIVYSTSTRKPRPTKQQKLMKEHGVERPEDLPQHLRTRQFGKGRRVMSDKEREERVARGERISNTPQLQFRQPLTAAAFPNKKKPSGSPLLSGFPSTSPTSNAARIDSPGAFGTGSTGSGPQTPKDSNLDPNLFANDLSFTNDDMNSGGSRPVSSGTDQQNSTFNLVDGAINAQDEDITTSHFESMFADYTNQDGDNDTSKAGGIGVMDDSVDPALFP